MMTMKQIEAAVEILRNSPKTTKGRMSFLGCIWTREAAFRACKKAGMSESNASQFNRVVLLAAEGR